MARWKKPKVRPQQARAARPHLFWLVAAGLIAALAGTLVARSLLRDGDSKPDIAALRGPVHVHGLGVNPGDGALYVATHTGMWRVAPGARNAKPVGESRQDTMGFTIVGPDHFLGSGHPDNLEQPPLLGLIESFDGGATWKPISLVGQADFHVLRAVGTRIYGYDVSRARLMVSSDGGESWLERKPTTSVLDVVPNPKRPDRIVATTGAGLLVSADAGATWRRIGRAIGLLAWPVPNRLYLADGDGDVLLSTRAGRSWRRVGALGGQPAAFVAHTARDLYAAVHNGGIMRSRDGGRSWQAVTSS